jgi:hypothetical protein
MAILSEGALGSQVMILISPEKFSEAITVKRSGAFRAPQENRNRETRATTVFTKRAVRMQFPREV